MPGFDFDATPKEQVIAMLGNMPDDLTFEDIQYHIDVLESWNLSEQSIREGRVYTQAEVEERMERLLARLEQEARERDNR